MAQQTTEQQKKNLNGIIDICSKELVEGNRVIR